MVAFIKDPANQLLKVQELNLLKMQEKNISSYWRRVGGRQVYLKVIFKKFQLIFSLQLVSVSFTQEVQDYKQYQRSCYQYPIVLIQVVQALRQTFLNQNSS